MDTLSDLFNAGVQGLTSFNTARTAQSNAAAAASNAAAANANAQAAQARSNSWKQYLPWVIGGAIVLAVVGWFVTRRN